MNKSFKDNYNKLYEKINLNIERLYVASFNIYAFYWLYKLLFVEGHTWEDWLLWFFACMGVNVFFRENKNRLLIKTEDQT
ncbi:hypothetical protein DMN80_23800 [Vibrio parahaemolyticus]|nr:hypothetical protein [Vibrio parahaemolyticus]